MLWQHRHFLIEQLFSSISNIHRAIAVFPPIIPGGQSSSWGWGGSLKVSFRFFMNILKDNASKDIGSFEKILVLQEALADQKQDFMFFCSAAHYDDDFLTLHVRTCRLVRLIHRGAWHRCRRGTRLGFCEQDTDRHLWARKYLSLVDMTAKG